MKTDRQTLQRSIFAACRQLGIDTETRHALQEQLTGTRSLSAMTVPQLKLVASDLREKGGFKAASKARPKAPRADLRLIHVMWRLLGEAGALERPGRSGLNAFVQARFAVHWGSVPADIDMLRDHHKIADVIDALRAWCARAGVELDR